jgi:hypothetical protein
MGKRIKLDGTFVYFDDKTRMMTTASLEDLFRRTFKAAVVPMTAHRFRPLIVKKTTVLLRVWRKSDVNIHRTVEVLNRPYQLSYPTANMCNVSINRALSRKKKDSYKNSPKTFYICVDEKYIKENSKWTE